MKKEIPLTTAGIIRTVLSSPWKESPVPTAGSLGKWDIRKETETISGKIFTEINTSLSLKAALLISKVKRIQKHLLREVLFLWRT